MKPRRTFLKFVAPVAMSFALAFLFVATFVAPSRAQDLPLFSAPSFPLLPQQNAPWTAPNAPEELVAATRVLFEHGLADPRGCEYRAITIAVGSVWGRGSLENTHGWLLPGDGDSNRFAIAWNGLLYPVVKIGVPANVSTDLKAESRFAEDRAKDSLGRMPTEAQSVRLPPAKAIGAALLLRLGEGEAATRLWHEVRQSNPRVDALWLIASRWLWARFDRALSAHLRGDDRLALLDLRALEDVKPKLEAMVRERGENPVLWGGEKQSPFRFLYPVPDLLADQERRAGRKAVSQQGLAALIAELENVRALRPAGNEGENSPGGKLIEDPLVQEIIAQGEGAVEPLLDVMENDDRLTRAVDFYRYYSPDRHVYTVAEAAYTALTAILNNYSFGSSRVLATSPHQRAEMVAQARNFWREYKEVGSAERWYRLLANDKAGAAQWILAAQNILRPADAVWRGGAWVVDPRLRGVKVGFSGEALRAHKNPSVSQLLARRVDALSRKAVQSQDVNGFTSLRQSGELALLLAEWDKKAAAASLRLAFQRAAQHLSNLSAGQTVRRPEVIRAVNESTALMPRLLRARLQAGDNPALDDYAKWLRRPTGAVPLNLYAEEVFLPLWGNRTHPGFTKTAWDLFEGQNSAYNPLLPRLPRSVVRDDVEARAALIASPLLSVAPFRRMIARELQVVAPYGIWQKYRDGRINIKLRGEVARNLAGALPVQQVEFRVCDYYAWKLSQVDGAPAFQLSWPQKQRDNALVALRGFLKRYGERLQPMASGEHGRSDEVRLVFPRLNRLASVDDVTRGAAIFTLKEPGQKRVVPIALPQRARRKAKSVVREGWVWQAEELLQNGQWRRFYGFVGPHEIARVPAEEIELIR